MENKELIWELQESIRDIYDQEELKSLSGLKKEYQLNNRNILDWYFKVIRANPKNQFNDSQVLDDIDTFSNQLLYLTANLYLYLPFINNPIDEGFHANGRQVYPNYQNLEAVRFNLFVDQAFQTTYNFWDRIGDIIASFFPEKLAPKDVYFSRVIDIVPIEYQKSLNFIWLKSFKENQYKALNDQRKQIVHYKSYQTYFNYIHLDNVDNAQGMTALLNQRNGMPNYFKEQIIFTLEGFEKTLLFLEEVNSVLFEEIQK